MDTEIITGFLILATVAFFVWLAISAPTEAGRQGATQISGSEYYQLHVEVPGQPSRDCFLTEAGEVLWCAPAEGR